MQNENEFPGKIRTAAREVLEEVRLNDRVRVDNVERQPDSNRFDVDLKEQSGPTEFLFHRFTVDPIQALRAKEGVTSDSLKPIIRREILKLFPATQL